jgi:hypothetical protein
MEQSPQRAQNLVSQIIVTRVPNVQQWQIRTAELSRVKLLNNSVGIYPKVRSCISVNVKDEHALAWIQGSATGLPDTNTTTVGLPAAFTALTRSSCAPTSPRSLTSTCSPVVAFVPGVLPGI